MVTVEDMKGTVDIPANPQRVVDVSGSADELIILGVPFIGSANTSMFDGVTVPPNLEEYFTENNVEVVGNYSGSVGELNLEKIAELEPDLIIMNIRHEKVYDQLKEIAPKVGFYLTIDCIEWRLVDAACKTKLIVRMPQIFFPLQESLKISHGPFAAF